jgi:putative transposase
VLEVHPSGYYAWRHHPYSKRHHEDLRLLELMKPSWLESGRVYGYRKVHHDMLDLGESCSRHRVARLMRSRGWRAQVGYRRRPGFHGGALYKVAANILDRQFDVTAPNTAWVTDITVSGHLSASGAAKNE